MISHRRLKIKAKNYYYKIRFYTIIMNKECNLYQKKKEIFTEKKSKCTVLKKYINSLK